MVMSAERPACRVQRTLRTILMFPMMFSPILVGFQFKFIFNDNIKEAFTGFDISVVFSKMQPDFVFTVSNIKGKV